MLTASLENKHRLLRMGLYSKRIQTLLILLVGVIAYANSFTVPMQFDDYRTLANAYKNFPGKDLGLLSTGASRWVTDATFALDRYIHGYWINGYHIVNLTIHLGAALVVYGLLVLILDRYRGAESSTHEPEFLNRFVPIATSLLFVCHPIQTEAVTYISQRYTSLASLLYLLALFFFFKAREAMTLCPVSSRFSYGLKWWLAFTVSALLAMKSKQISITLPVMVATLEGLFFRGYLYKKVPFLVLLAALLAVVPIQEIYTQNIATRSPVSQIVKQASAETDVISRQSYFLTQQRVGVTYLRLLLFPIKQNLDYDYPIFTSIKEWPALVSLLANLFLICLAIYLLIRSKLKPCKTGPEDAMHLAGTGIIWFYLTMSVESSFIPISDVIFEHRLYLPSVGFFMALTAGISGLASWRPNLQRFAWYGIAALVIVMTTATIMRNNVWKSDLGLWMDVLEKSPNKARSRYFAGTLFLKRNLLNQAVYNFVRAIELDPARDLQRITLNHTIATMFPQFEKRSSTGGSYQSEFERVNPDQHALWLAVSYNNLGLAYEFLNNPAQAKYYFSLAVNMNPDLDIAWFNLALSAASQHDAAAYKQAVGRLVQLNSKLQQMVQ